MRNETIDAHYRKNFKLLVKRATWRVPNKSVHLAEEVVQDAYLKAIRFWNTFNPERNEFGAWFNRIFNGSVADCIRRENGHSNPSLDNEDDYLEPFILDEDVDIPREIVIRVKKAIEEQPAPNNDVLNMFFNLGMNSNEIAECTNLTAGNVRQIIRRFRIKWDGENIF